MNCQSASKGLSAGIGFATAAAIPPISPVEKQWRANEDAHSIFNRICALADRLAGTQPEADDLNKAVKGGGGLFGEIDMGAERLMERASDAQSALARIERLLPGGL